MNRRLPLAVGVGAAVAIATAGIPLAAHAATGGTASLTINQVVAPCLLQPGTPATASLCGDPVSGGVATDPGVFNIVVSDPGDSTATPPAAATNSTTPNAANGGTTGAISVATTDAGTVVTIAENTTSTTPATVFADYTYAYSCTQGTGFPLTGNAVAPFSFTITNGMSITCTITATRSNAGGPIAQDILGSGSDTTQFMMHQIDGLYQFSPGCQQVQLNSSLSKWYDFSCLSPDPTGTATTENYEHDQVHQATFLGSSAGVTQLCNRGLANVAPIDFARSSRAPKSTDCHGLHFVSYAKDGITIEAFDDGTTASGVHAFNNSDPTSGCPANVFCLSQNQVKAIYVTCTITNWNQVSTTAGNVPIKLYTPQPSSGTRSTFDGFIGGSSSSCAGTQVIDENTNSQFAAADVPALMYPFSVGVWKVQVNGAPIAGTTQVPQLASIDGVAASPGTIQTGSFPYSRQLFNVFCPGTVAGGCKAQANPNAAAATQSYVGEEGWICKPVAAHGATDPVTGLNYHNDIFNTIQANGFVNWNSGAPGPGLPADFCRLTVS